MFENAVADREGPGWRGAHRRRVRHDGTGDACSGGHYVKPTIVRAKIDMPIVREETFAPILYVMSDRRRRAGDPDPERRAAGPELGDLHQ